MTKEKLSSTCVKKTILTWWLTSRPFSYRHTESLKSRKASFQMLNIAYQFIFYRKSTYRLSKMSSSLENSSLASKLPDVHDYILFDDYDNIVKLWSELSNDCFNLSYSKQAGFQSNCYTEVES